MLFARPLAELIAELERLPGVGPKSAQRLAYHLLRVTDAEASRLGMLGGLNILILLTIVYMMVAKPGGVG